MIQTDYVSLEFGMAEKMRCDNDWGELKEIIVGTAKGYHFPDYNKSFHSCQFPEYDVKKVPYGTNYPAWVINEQESCLLLLLEAGPLFLEVRGMLTGEGVHKRDH